MCIKTAKGVVHFINKATDELVHRASAFHLGAASLRSAPRMKYIICRALKVEDAGLRQ
jgi:hypothetical protein